MSYSNIKQDANGNYYVEGIKENELTQQQLDYNELVQNSQKITGPDGVAARNAISNNPNASAGMVAGLYKSGAIGDSKLVQTMLEIDKLTQEQRAQDDFKKAQEESNKRFARTPWGFVWNAIKGTSRGITTLAFTPFEALLNMGKAVVAESAGAIQDASQGKFVDTRPLSEQLKAVNPLFTLEQLTAYQALKELITTGKINAGSGFFFNEETGAAFKARQKQMELGKVAVMKDGVQVKDKDGVPLYRPYSPIDPVSFVITGGHLEDGNARFVNAIGELGLMIWRDPVRAYSKLAREKKALDLAIASGAGVKDAKRAVILDSKIKEAELKTKESLDALTTGRVNGELSLLTRAEREKVYKDAFDAETKLKDYKLNGFNYDSIATFLSGQSGEHIIDGIANIDNWQTIRNISRRGGKAGFTVEQSVALANAKTRDEVLAVIAPYIANGTVAQNLLETGNTTSRFLSRIAKGNIVKPAQGIVGWAAKSIRKVPYITKQMESLNVKYNTYFPAGGTFVHYADKDGLVDAVANYGRSLGLDNLTISKISNDIAQGTDASVTGYKAVTELFNSIFKANEAAFNKAGISTEKLQDLIKVFDKERKSQSSYWAELHASGAQIDIVASNGKIVTVSGPHIESEFLNSMIYFPPAKELAAELSKVRKFGSIRRGALGKSFDAVDAFTSGFWKKVVLTRPAYVMRNIGEEQIRVMFTGHASFFNSPLAAIGMAVGKQDGPAWRKVLSSFDNYKNTVIGKDFKYGAGAEELGNEALAHSALFDYAGFMDDISSGASREISKISQLRGYKNVQVDEPLFWDAIANEIRILRQSSIAKAVARTRAGGEANTVEYFISGAGKETWNRFASARDEGVKNWLLTREGARTFLFDGVTPEGKAASLRARIEQVSGQGGEASDAIRSLIANGELTAGNITLRVPTAEDSALNSIKNAEQIRKNRKSMNDANQVFAKQLESIFKGKGNWAGIRFKVQDPTTILTKANENRINQFINNFFDLSVKAEKISTMGPEWRMYYWDVVSRLTLSADETALQFIKKNAPKTLAGITTPSGVSIGTKHPIWKILDNAKGDGSLTKDEIHEFATRAAGQHVKELFYDASKKRLFWHQLRLLFPFGQAWSDTITKWGKLAFDNPDQVYKVARNLNWLQTPESSALYQMTDAKDYYDPNQGFFFTDPLSGQKQFFIPFMSTGMNFLANAIRFKPSTQGAFATAANPQSFNFALGSGVVLPGFGPGLTLSLAVLDGLGKNPIDLLPYKIKDSVYKYIYPFGGPDISNIPGLANAVTSSNIGRTLAGLVGAEEGYAGSFAPVMNYLASSGEYNIDDPADQTRLIKDTNSFAQYFMLSRGIFGFFSPFAIQPKDLTKDESGNLLLAASLYQDFRKIEEESSFDRNAAYAKFLDLYGPEQVFAIISATSGGPNNLFTYNLIMKDPSVVDKYPDVYGYLYPNGGFSQELYRWQLRTGKRQRLSAQEILDKATNVRFYAAKDRLLARSVGEGWDSKRTEAALSSLADSYELKNRKVVFDASKDGRIREQLRQAAYDTRFTDSDAATGLRDYLLLRDKAIQASGRTSLNNKSSEAQREWLAERALEIIQKHPDFQKIYYSFFKKELEG